MNLQPTPSYGCPYCPFIATSPAMRLHHLNDAHSETVDMTGAEAAQARLKDILERTAARYRALLAAHDE